MPEKIITSDGKHHDVSPTLMGQSALLKAISETTVASDHLELPNISSETFVLINQFSEHVISDPVPFLPEPLTDHIEKFLNEWYTEFLPKSLAQLIDLTDAAEYLQMHDLQRLCCACTASQYIRGKSTGEIRQLFGIVTDLSVADQAKWKNQKEWVASYGRVNNQII